jgi:hypothetical protein
MRQIAANELRRAIREWSGTFPRTGERLRSKSHAEVRLQLQGMTQFQTREKLARDGCGRMLAAAEDRPKKRQKLSAQ